MDKLGLSILLLVGWGTASAQPVFDPNIWGGLGGGAYTGQDYPDDPSSSDDEHTKVGGYQTHASFNLTGRAVGLRGRWTHMFDFTSNAADEYAAEAAVSLLPSRQLWLAAGVSRLTDVSNDRKAPTIGFPVEVMFYPVRGLELMVHANFNEDSNYIGFGVGGAIGRQR